MEEWNKELGGGAKHEKQTVREEEKKTTWKKKRDKCVNDLCRPLLVVIKERF